MPPRLQFEPHDSLRGVESLTTIHGTDDHPQTHGSTPSVAFHYWCYVLHGFLLVLQIVLLAMLWSHPEHGVTIAFDNSALTIGLSAFLQTFYTLYTALLVFITQRLALSCLLLRPHKLTATHDVSAAWAGLGAATATLWQQTKIATSTRAALLVFFYLSCISVLHVASPTIMEFQPYNAISIVSVPSNATWPEPSVNLTTLNMGATGPLIPLVSSLPGLSTDGLINSTLYDTFSKTSQMINASVNANTIQAKCGLLSNLTYTTEGAKDAVMISTSMSGVGQVFFSVAPPPYDDISFITDQCTQCQSYALVYLVSTAMNISDSVGNNNISLDIILDYAPPGEASQNTSTTVYIAACSLEVSNYTYNLEIQSGNLEPTIGQPDAPAQTWSLWTPLKNNLGTQLDLMVSSAYHLTGCDTCDLNQVMNAYLMSLLNINATTNNTPSVFLTPYQIENAVSQMTAQLIWIASQLSEENGGFAPTASFAKVREQVPRWRLNINATPAIFTFSASFFLVVTVYLMLGIPSKTVSDLLLVEGTTVLEMLWTGGHTSSLRNHLKAIDHPSPTKLRSGGMFVVNLAKDQNMQGSRDPEVAPLLARGFTTFEFEDSMQGTRTSDHRRSAQSRPRTLPFLKLSRRFWCYVLHGLFVLLHIILLLMLIRHPEHRVVVQSVSEVSTTALAESLQLFYVVYTVILVFVTQRLALCRAIVRKQTLTSVHDLSQAWTGIGSALVGSWQQTKVAASLRTMFAITMYYLCISALHVTSTTVMQFEVFSSGMNKTMQSGLAWPASLVNTTYDWDSLSPLVPLDQLPSLSSEGLINNTVYDTPSVDPTSVNATVNATTVNANCGLLSNLSFDSDLSLTTTVPGMGLMTIPSVPAIWKDTVLFLGFSALRNYSNPNVSCSKCDSYLIYWVTTALNFDESLLGDLVSVSTNWTSTPPGGTETLSNTTTYVVACSLNATTTLDVLDVQNNVLSSANQPQSDVPPETWQLWSPGGVPALGSEISLALTNANFFNFFFGGYAFTAMDAYTMSLFGINVTANNAVSATQSSANPSVTLSPSLFEDAISQIAAQYIWAAGHTNGHFGPAYGFGESTVTDLVVLRRLNVNTIPVVIASIASVVLFILAFYMVGVTPSTPSAITTLGVLETLWLEAHSEVLHERMMGVEEPTVYNLRVAGMFEICIADDVREVLDREYDVVDDG